MLDNVIIILTVRWQEGKGIPVRGRKSMVNMETARS